MWSRKFIKDRSKAVLKFTYWKALLISLVITIAGGSQRVFNGSNSRVNFDMYKKYFNKDTFYIIAAIALFFAFLGIIALLFRIFVGYMLEVGGRKFFIKAADGDVNTGYLGYGFQSGNYSNVLVTMLLKSIYIFLWTLLFIIPGIIKSYAYRMVPYILADNPNIGVQRAIELSNEMTRGEKWNIFVLDLSFIGWYLLGSLLFGIGVFFVKPYDDATNAELYLILRKQALDQGLTSYSELNLMGDGSQQNNFYQ